MTPYSVTYDGTAHTATGTATGVLSESLSGPGPERHHAHQRRHLHSDAWTFTDVTGNYNNASGTVNDSIAKANAAITVTPYSVTYDGAAHTATGTATGVLSESLSGLDLSGTTHTNAGTLHRRHLDLHRVTGNYNNASGTVNDSIAKANAVISVTPYNVTYDGNAHTATGTATGRAGRPERLLDLTRHDAHQRRQLSTDTWTFTGDRQLQQRQRHGHRQHRQGERDDRRDTLQRDLRRRPRTRRPARRRGRRGESERLAGPWWDDAHDGRQLSTDPWTFPGDANYNNASGTVGDSIAKAPATVALSNLTQVFTGSPLTPTATTTPPGLTITWSNAPKTNTGTYAVTATVNEANYQGEASGSFVVAAWTTAGFYQPVDMSTAVVIWNTVKGGSTVPLKFNLFAGSTEKTSVSDIKTFYQGQVGCTAGFEDTVDATLLSTGGTILRYSGIPGSGGQFIQNWQTPKQLGCYKVTMTANDGSTVSAFFRLK